MFGRWKFRRQPEHTTVEIGMSSAQVKRLWGSPRNSFTEEEYQQGQGRVVISGVDRDWLAHNEYWFYEGFPREGITTMITFHKGRVHKMTEGQTH